MVSKRKNLRFLPDAEEGQVVEEEEDDDDMGKLLNSPGCLFSNRYFAVMSFGIVGEDDDEDRIDSDEDEEEETATLESSDYWK